MSKLVETHVSTFQFPHSAMGDLKARIKAKLLRRHSAAYSFASSKNSSRSGRPQSQHTNNDATSSIHTSHEAGERSDHRDDVKPGAGTKTWGALWRGNGHAGGYSPISMKQHAGKSRPSTAASSTRHDDQKEAVAYAAPDESDSLSQANTPTPASKESGPTAMAMALASDASVDDASSCEEAPSSGRGGQPLPGASSNLNASTSTSTSKKTSSSSPSGIDQHTTGPADANPSTTPVVNDVALPSIHEHPATPPNLVSSDPIDPASNHISTALLQAPPISLNTASASATATSAVDSQPASALPSSDLEDITSIDVATPISPGAVPACLPSSPDSNRPSVPRRQSILPNRQQALIQTLLDSPHAHDLDPDQLLPISANMVTRKIWVKRPGASATMITINEDDLVDDVRDMILRKYANSLGRQFDSPDLTLRVAPREQPHRQLQPDEPMGRTLDAYFPGGQTVDDALLIDIPPRRTPKASPNIRYYAEDSSRPHESGTDYFPPFLPQAPHSQHSNIGAGPTATIHFPPSMAIVNNGQLPPLPSPGGSSRRLGTRPKIQRLHTASPISTAASHVQHPQHIAVPPPSIGTHSYSSKPQRSRTHSGASSDQPSHAAHPHPPPSAPPMPTPPIAERVATPPPRVASPRPSTRPKKKRTVDPPTLPPGMLNGSVPPINVLIVEDNIINLKLLEAFVKRLKVRWQTAMNGRDAVNKWRSGGFHLVLMDIQLPIMNGLDATREIRRIEKVNSIGVFSSSANKAPQEVQGELDEKDKLPNTEMFKSPVIIVALTASSLQSDRHEALAAGCNDFLTKPVNFVWLERKVMEWGCMQALIDFDGWRKWKDFSQKAGEDDAAKKSAALKAKARKNRQSIGPATASAAA
ncbi:putative Response regulatory domain-containing protein [Seiridium cardinale]|uniref:Response regulatory domain-containing protein n=1 Tax=Seiridium cardinale TaxID=138064 RepID=A0ABR2XUJ3_9PEZI